MVYTLVMGKRTPTLTPEEIRVLEFAFRLVDEERYTQRMVKFPYNFIL
jgi:ABC-type transporter MlaC component